jgi:hypothetical protein
VALCGTTKTTIRTGRALSPAIQTFHLLHSLRTPPTKPHVSTFNSQASCSGNLIALVMANDQLDEIYLSPAEDAEEDWQVVASTTNHHLVASDLTPRPSQDDDFSGQESDEEYAAHLRGEIAPGKKKGGYDSRIEQILYENPQLPILITDAGKSSESGGKYIVYTIRTGVSHIIAICVRY